jgi:phosphate starvation-inducible membrane PsiE
LYYICAVAATEFLTYAATKMYICLNLNASYLSAPINAATKYVSLYNAADAIYYNFNNNAIIYEAVVVSYFRTNNHSDLRNVIFSRLAFSNLDSIIFVGYRVTLN